MALNRSFIHSGSQILMAKEPSQTPASVVIIMIVKSGFSIHTPYIERRLKNTRPDENVIFKWSDVAGWSIIIQYSLLWSTASILWSCNSTKNAFPFLRGLTKSLSIFWLDYNRLPVLAPGERPNHQANQRPDKWILIFHGWHKSPLQCSEATHTDAHASPRCRMLFRNWFFQYNHLVRSLNPMPWCTKKEETSPVEQEFMDKIVDNLIPAGGALIAVNNKAW